MNLVSVLEGNALAAALRALDEGRLWWRVADQYGRSCNGGQPVALPPSSPGEPGAWAPRIDRVKICHRGYHVTSDPIIWRGQTVALVEVECVVQRGKDKAVCGTLRELGVVDPTQCVDDRIRAAAMRPNLSRADLSGADLSGADLCGAYLRGADLSVADLGGANLGGAYLRGADLFGADLSGANLGGADLYGANLSGADLSGAYLGWAYLRGASLSGADLSGANLGGQDVEDLKRRGAIL